MASEQHALWTVTTMEELGRMMQLLLREVLELAGNVARDSRCSVLVPFDLRLAIANDAELFETLGQCTKVFYPPEMWEEAIVP